MSLWIVPSRVRRVLLADGWHVVKGRTFEIDAYQYLDASTPGGADSLLFSSGTGFRFELPREAGGGTEGPSMGSIAGPMSSILAVELAPEDED